MGRPATAPGSPSPNYSPTQQEAQTINNPPSAQVYPPPQLQPQPPQQPDQYPPANANIPMPPSPQKAPVMLPQENVVAGVPTTMLPANAPVSFPPRSPLSQANIYGANMGMNGTNMGMNADNMGMSMGMNPVNMATGASMGSIAANLGMNGDNMGINGTNLSNNGGSMTIVGGDISNIGSKPFIGTAVWTTGLFHCFDDPSNAMVTVLFPCVTFGQIAEVLDEGHTTCATSGTIYLCTFCKSSRRYRQKLRMKYGLMEAPASDWMAHSLFEWCALCQEYRELANRGLHPTLGWQGNTNAGEQMQDNRCHGASSESNNELTRLN